MSGPAPAPAGARRSHVLYVHFDGAGAAGPGRHDALLALLTDITPVVQALPPDAALADVRGALRYFGRDAVDLARLVRLRALALYGTDCTV
ncbi:DNA polymerase, partial [Streptomyces nanshensis]